MTEEKKNRVLADKELKKVTGGLRGPAQMTQADNPTEVSEVMARQMADDRVRDITRRSFYTWRPLDRQD